MAGIELSRVKCNYNRTLPAETLGALLVVRHTYALSDLIVHSRHLWPKIFLVRADFACRVRS